MNQTIELMLNHKSIRKYKDKPISSENLNAILKASVSAPSSSFLQCTSIIRVVNKTKREKLASLAGNQAYVVQAAEFLVFCIDFHKHKTLIPNGHYGYTEQVLLGAIDCGLISQNALLAAQSLEIGGVYIGGIRNNPIEVCELLELPEQVFPMFGLCLGYPDQLPEVKPRLPLDITVHQDKYNSLDLEKIKRYDYTLAEYYDTRTTNQKDNTWTADIEKKLSKESRAFMQDALKKQGFMTII